jgi:hypothetical protein
VGLFLSLTYSLGVISGGYGVFFWRAGLIGFNELRGNVDWREFALSNIPFLVLVIAKSVVWPVVLVVWLATGRKRSPWVATTRLEGREVRAVIRRDRAISAGLVVE